MFGLVAKAVVSGTVIYAVVRLLEQTQLVEKGLAVGVQLADGLLTKIDKMTEGKAQV